MIFSPFEQVKDKQLYSEGTGLGLAISQRLVGMMDSELHVKSTPGQGSTFWFDVELPEVAEEVKPETKETRKIIGVQGNPQKILIVDDKDENRDVLKDMLLSLDFEVLEAVDGREAILKAGESQPDLILMDLIMPVMDGFEATRRIRQIPALQNVVVIAVSASAFEQTKEESLTAGCDDFLAKPIAAQNLFDKLQTHLNVEWIYEAELDGRPSQSGVHLAEEPIIPPPPEELSLLYNLAKIGDIMEIRERIQELERGDPKFAAFTARLRQLAKDLNIVEIQQFLKHYIKEE